ncbi:MAG TPA: hypothetical protein VKV30_16560 [Candidatus Angelobacter sp.]|nr:hypothetical protein [Candidatus Angelobacter sp.]
MTEGESIAEISDIERDRVMGKSGMGKAVQHGESEFGLWGPRVWKFIPGGSVPDVGHPKRSYLSQLLNQGSGGLARLRTAHAAFAKMSNKAFAEDLVPIFTKPAIAKFKDHFRTIEIVNEPVVRAFSSREVYTFPCKSLLDKYALLDDIEFQNEKELHWAYACNKDSYGTIMALNLSPLILVVTGAKLLVDADIFGYIWPFRGVQ